MREPEAVAELRRALGKELAAFRRAAGYTQTELAELTEYSRSTIGNVETGRQHVPREFWERADSCLRTGGVLASGQDEVEAAARRALRVAARNVSTARKAGAVRNGARGGEPSPLSASMADVASMSGAVGKPLGELRDVIRLRSMRQHLKSIDNAHGGGAALPMVVG